MRKLIPYIPFVLLFAFAIVGLSFSSKEQQNLQCTNVIITIEKDEYANQFITEEDIYKTLQITKENLLRKKVSKIDIHNIETILENNPTILNSEAYIVNNTELHIKVQQRIPMVYVIAQSDKFYIDNRGWLMPLSKNYTARTIIASGNIYEGFRKKVNVFTNQKIETSCLQDLLLISRELKKDDFFNALIEQIYVIKKGDYILIAKVGPQTIYLGSTEELEKKLTKLKAFYMSEKVKENWNLYSSINVKFQHQIVCTKY